MNTAGIVAYADFLRTLRTPLSIRKCEVEAKKYGLGKEEKRNAAKDAGVMFVQVKGLGPCYVMPEQEQPPPQQADEGEGENPEYEGPEARRKTPRIRDDARRFPWTEWEDKHMALMLCAGSDWDVIGREVLRTPVSCRIRANRLTDLSILIKDPETGRYHIRNNIDRVLGQLHFNEREMRKKRAMG